MLKLKLGSIPARKISSNYSVRKPQWYKAEQDDIDQFTHEVYNKLAAIDAPKSLWCNDPNCNRADHSQERDSFLIDIMSAVIECSYENIPLSGRRRPLGKPDCPIESCIPGWKEIVEPYKSDARFWHAVWQSSERPNQGVLKDIMSRTRNQYHYAVRRLRKMANAIRARKLFEASETGSCELLKEMKKVKGGPKNDYLLPDTIGEAHGENEIAEAFKKVYSTLYNSSDSSQDMIGLKQSLNNAISNESLTEVNKITPQMVKSAASKMKPMKSDVSGSYTSDAILNAPDIFFSFLSLVYKSWLVHGTVTLSLLSCAFLPLFKGGLKDPANLDNYRAIAGSSLLLKLFDNVVISIWGDKMNTDSLQFGFKSGTSTTECSWLVLEVANYFIRRHTPCIVTMLDCTKAFDTCKFSILFKKLYEKNLPAILIRTLIFIYEEQVAWVKWGSSKSGQFRIVNGTRQGSVLSPFLFAIYIDELLADLRRSGVGCYIGGKFFGALGYADDIILLAP